MDNQDPTPLIFISGHANIPMAVKAMKDGAFEFFTKPLNNQSLLDTIFDALQGNPKQQSIIAENYHRKFSKLSAREISILELMARGFPPKTIADQLGISKNTVDVHRANILRKMEARSIAQLVAEAVHYQKIEVIVH